MARPLPSLALLALVVCLLGASDGDRATPRAGAALPGVAAAAETPRQPATAAPRGAVRSTAGTLPDDPGFSDGSGEDCFADTQCWPYRLADLPAAWSALDAQGAAPSTAWPTIAVVDTGVDAAHPDLAPRVLTGYDLVAGGTASTDDEGHGTAVAGVMAAGVDNHIGVPGVCGRCFVLPVKVLDASGLGTTESIAQGVAWAADNGARVINLSLASTADDPAVSAAIDYAIGHGVVVVAAAGNAGSADPASCLDRACGGYPAALSPGRDGLISVGAVDPMGRLYGFSNRGGWVDVAAPGCVGSTSTSGDYLSSFCGTSAAASFVAGEAALLVAIDPALTPAQVEGAVEGTAQGDATGGTVHGEVDVYKALESVGLAPPPAAAPARADAVQVSLVGSTSVGGNLHALLRAPAGVRVTGSRWLVCRTRSSCSTATGGASSLSVQQAYAGGWVRVLLRLADARDGRRWQVSSALVRIPRAR